MGHHHVHPYLIQTLAMAAAALVPLGLLALVGGAWWEAHRRKHGHAARPGSRRAEATARFLAGGASSD
jgi:hypothetical protein